MLPAHRGAHRCCFFFSSRRRHTRLQGDWSSDVCSSDLVADYLNTERGTRNAELSRRKPVVILGYDTRFLGREFSLAAAEVLTANGLLPQIGRASCRERV